MRTLMKALEANAPNELAIAAGVVLGVLLLLAVLRYLASRALNALAARSAAPIHRVLADTVDATRLWLFLPLAVYLAASPLILPPRVGHPIELVTVIALMLQAAVWGDRFIRRWFEQKGMHRPGGDGETSTALGLISILARTALWAITLLLILNHLGVNITALVAGLGIGGVAVALALQNVLGDLLASLAIVLDKPFVVGDFIVVDDVKGEVERVGIKTTRLRSIDGEQLVISNADLLKSRVRNFRRMSERRVLLVLGIAYETPQDKVARAPDILREIVTAQERVRFERSHFRGFGESALELEAVYFVLDRDYKLHMDIQQAINLEIVRRFGAEGITFAYPTRTLYLRSATGPAAEGVGEGEKAGKP